VLALGLIAAAVQVIAIGPAPPATIPPSAAQVRAAFLHAWQGYRRYAWGHDDLDSLSRKPHDLLLAPPETLDLSANTEAHPLRVSRSRLPTGGGPGE
jgi:hypothetical protein